MKRTYNLVKNGICADHLMGKIPICVTLIDIERGFLRFEPFVPMEIGSIDEASDVLTTQVTSAFVRFGIVADPNEVADIVEAMRELILRDHPGLRPSLTGIIRQKIGGTISSSVTELPSSGATRILLFIAKDDSEISGVPFAGVDVYLTSPASVANSEKTLSAQIEVFANNVNLSPSEAKVLSDYIIDTFRSQTRR